MLHGLFIYGLLSFFTALAFGFFYKDILEYSKQFYRLWTSNS